jgi:cobalt/nickel transport system ATP-binding protein
MRVENLALIEANDLHYHYDRSICALQGLNLTVRAGSKLAVLGANGAGKSTLFLHLNGTLKPERGEIRLHNERADYTRKGLSRWRQMVGLVLQNPDDQLFAATVEQDVSFGPLNIGLDETAVRQRVSEALCALEIETLRDRPTHLLSFGQRKRVAIAGAVAMRPKLLILDEPSAGLDPEGVRNLLITLDELHARGTTLLMATHDLDLACAWADEIALLQSGRVLKQGEVAEIMSDAGLLKQAHLCVPLVLEIGQQLQCLGLLSHSEPLPRTRAALLSHLGKTNSISVAT